MGTTLSKPPTKDELCNSFLSIVQDHGHDLLWEACVFHDTSSMLSHPGLTGRSAVYRTAVCGGKHMLETTAEYLKLLIGFTHIGRV
jgi:hypothetical protein